MLQAYIPCKMVKKPPLLTNNRIIFGIDGCRYTFASKFAETASKMQCFARFRRILRYLLLLSQGFDCRKSTDAILMTVPDYDVTLGHLALGQSQQQENDYKGGFLQGRKHTIRAAQQPFCKCNMHKNKERLCN